MKFILLLAFTISVSSRATFDTVFEKEWNLFKLKYSKVYKNPVQHDIHKKIFYENKLSIYKHNQLYELGQVSFTQGVNEYSDLGYDEFLATMTGYLNSRNDSLESHVASEGITFIEPDIAVPSSVDWRKKGAVTEVKNQGRCGSCWAFSAIGALEAQHFQKTKKLVSLSEQNLVDCSRRNHGCRGGWPTYAFQYIIDNRGIDTEDSYRYEARDGYCRYNPRNSGATVRQYGNIRSGDERALEKAVAVLGPISVAIDVPKSLERYRKGVYYDAACNPRRLLHAVLVVGYGSTSNGQEYWIVKNSWGTSWGDNGYVLMAKNKGNSCGIASQASYPLV